MAELTPMMRQYMDIKQQNPDSLLFFRLGRRRTPPRPRGW